jgi:ABC-type glycerol-3-phosphate transport system substrate-binding protein
MTMMDVLAEKAALHYENLGGGYSYPLAIMENLMTDKNNGLLYYIGAEHNPDMFYGPIPYTPGQTEEIRTAYVTAALAIPAASEKQDSAWNFISWCMGQTELFDNHDAYYYSFPTRTESIGDSLDRGINEISYLYASEYLEPVAAEKMYAEVTSVGYAYLSDQAAGKALETVVAQGASVDAKQLYENLLAVYSKSDTLFE